MKLAGKNIVFLNRSMNGHAVFCGCFHDLGILGLQIIGMDKIYVCLLRDALKQPSVILKMKGIPSHVGNLKSLCWRNLHDPAFQKSKSLHAWSLLTGLKQKLKPQTDSKKRCLLVRDLADDRNKTEFIQIIHGVSKASHSRKNHFIRVQKHLGISGNHCLLSQIMKSFFHTLYVAGVIVNYTYHSGSSCCRFF